MKKNTINNIKNLIKISVASICIVIIAITSFIAFNKIDNKAEINSPVALANISEIAMAEANADFIYLSNLDYIENKSSVEWGNIEKDQTTDGNKITVRVENGVYSFDKGMWAHAKSTLVYDLRELNFDYFTSHVGLNTTSTKGNGVVFYIFTSQDGENWQLKIDPITIQPNTNSVFVKVDIKDANYLKLYADDNGGNGQDHAVYADAKLINGNYEENVVPSVQYYDDLIKNKYSDMSLDSEEFELLLLQRNFINNVGQFALNRFVNESHENKETLDWLFNDLENLRLYTIGGTPDGSYYNSLKVLKDLLKNYKSDFDIKEKTVYGTVLGDLYKRMAITLSLTHSTNVALWMQPGNPLNQSNAVTRYQIYKDMHKNGNLRYTSTIDFAKWYEQYEIEEMRYVMNNIIDDQEILWLNEYTQSFIDANPGNPNWYLSPHPYMKYLWPNYNRPEYYNEDNKAKYDEKYKGIFSKYGVIFGEKGVQKLWMNIEGGAVCGGISKQGSNNRGVHGVPSTVVSQPGHAAFAYYTMDNNGNGFWTLNNVINGWEQSGKTERLSIRMPLGWGNDAYVSGWAASYLLISQAAINDFTNYEKAEKIIMIADIYKNDIKKQEEIYRNALKAQSINLDAWYNLIKLYNSDSTKTEEDYYNLAEELAEALRCYPLPMYNLTNLIKPKLTSNEYSFKFVLLQTRILEYGKSLSDSSSETYQPGATREVANFLLGNLDKTIATFSFDGEDAGKIVLSNRFDSAGIRWDYSIDGKKTWNEVSFTADEEHKYLLSTSELNSITDENDIYVHIVGVDYSENNLYKIDILTPTTLTGIYNNDQENKVIGVTDYMEWRMEGSNKWTLFSDELPDLTGDKTIIVRAGKHGVYLISNEITLEYTKDVINNKRKYVTVDQLSIASVSSEATGNQGHAANAIDGNINTRWHSAWNGTDVDKFIVIKLENPINLSAIEYLPAGGGNGKILNAKILTSLDGESWTEIVESTNWANNDTLKSIELDNPITTQYIKIVGTNTSSASSLSFIAARMFNIYEDITKAPTAEVEYDITSPTSKNVTVRLVNPSEEITITNNGGKDTYVFKKNGSFTFEFVNKNNIKGEVTATVKNIDKKPPTATIKYSTKNKTSNNVIVTLVNESEPITVTNNSGNKTYTFTENGTFEFIYKDEAGNIGKTVAKVDWIVKDNKNNNSNSESNKNEKPTNNNNSNNNPNTEQKNEINNDSSNKDDNKLDSSNNIKDNNILENSKNEENNDKIKSESDKSIWGTILYYAVPFVLIILISFILTILQGNRKYK